MDCFFKQCKQVWALSLVSNKQSLQSSQQRRFPVCLRIMEKNRSWSFYSYPVHEHVTTTRENSGVPMTFSDGRQWLTDRHLAVPWFFVLLFGLLVWLWTIVLIRNTMKRWNNQNPSRSKKTDSQKFWWEGKIWLDRPSGVEKHKNSLKRLVSETPAAFGTHNPVLA